MPDARDAARMDEALELARRGWGQTSPNPLVGAVVYNGDNRVGSGYHARFGEAHAEVIALGEAGERARGATLYATLEPCSHHGKTPPCVDAIVNAGISRVVIAARDPNPVAAGGADRLRAAGIAIDIGVQEHEAREINAAFFNSTDSDRPWVTLKLALSLDGAITGAGRTGGWLTGEQSRDEVQRLRAASDAIAVGIQTALVDNPRLTARTDPPPRIAPMRIVFDRSARLPVESVLAKTAREIPTLLVTSRAARLSTALADAGVEQLTAVDVGDALHKLKARGIVSLLVEGGAGLAASFLAGGFVDRLVIFRAPIILGEGALGAFSGIASQEVQHAPRLTLIVTRALGDDVMSVYSVRKG